MPNATPTAQIERELDLAAAAGALASYVIIPGGGRWSERSPRRFVLTLTDGTVVDYPTLGVEAFCLGVRAMLERDE